MQINDLQLFISIRVVTKKIQELGIIRYKIGYYKKKVIQQQDKIISHYEKTAINHYWRCKR
jgi:hypothetical protein